MNKIEKSDLSMLEENLVDCIMEWQESKKDPLKNLELVREYANEILAIALNPIPCWEKLKKPFLFNNGIVQAPNGAALVQDGYFVMVDDLVEWLPRILDE